MRRLRAQLSNSSRQLRILSDRLCQHETRDDYNLFTLDWMTVLSSRTFDHNILHFDARRYVKSFKESPSPIQTPSTVGRQRTFSYNVNIMASPLKRIANMPLANMILPDAELTLRIALEVVDFAAVAEPAAANY